MKKAVAHLLRAFLLFVLAVGTAGCVRPSLATIDSVARKVEDAARLLDWARSVASIWFLAHPDAVKQAAFERALATCQVAADAVVRAGDGADEASAGKYAAAKDEFAKGWRDVEQLLGQMGVVGAPGVMGRPAMPRPLLLDG